MMDETFFVSTYTPDNMESALLDVTSRSPTHTAFVATAEECTRKYIVNVCRFCRRINPHNPYTDTFWGIITGPDAATAMRVALCEGFTISKVAANTEFEMRCVPGGSGWCDELVAGLRVEKPLDGGKVSRTTSNPHDSTQYFVDMLSTCDLLITSSHGTERDVQLGHTYKNGFIATEQGGDGIVGVDTSGVLHHPIRTTKREKAWLAVGNCLVGHVDHPTDSIALTMMKGENFMAMAAYTVVTWYGYAGWGLLDYFVEQPGRYTLPEAVRANRIALEDRLYSRWPETQNMCFDYPEAHEEDKEFLFPYQEDVDGLTVQDGCGLLYDRDAFVYYGDPAAQIKMPVSWKAYEQTLTAPDDKDKGVWTLRAVGDFTTINSNGSQRGGRPIIQFLPLVGVGRFRVIEGEGWNPKFGPDWVMVPNPRVVFADIVIKFARE
eukprot:PhF_6_TR42898/c0_g2_i1/m.64999